MRRRSVGQAHAARCTLSWYDRFATFYDASLERLYAPSRQAMAAAFRDPPGRLLVVPCGTGQDLEVLVPRLAPGGGLLAVDLSAGMLARARHRVAAAGWSGVHLLQADAASLDAATVAAHLGPGPLDGVCFALGLTVFPAWEAVLTRCLDLLAPGGRVVILDVHAARWVPQTTVVQCMARADLRRRVWEPLEDRCPDLEHTWLPGSEHTFGGRLFLATGTVPA